MGIVRFNPSLVNRVFDDFFQNMPARTTNNGTLPAVNVKETDDNFQLELAVPGLKKDAFKIKVDDGVLSIAAENSETETSDQNGYTRREFSYKSFSRRFTLPEAADENSINATYADGILVVTLPKKEEAKPQPARLIEVV